MDEGHEIRGGTVSVFSDDVGETIGTELLTVLILRFRDPIRVENVSTFNF